MTRSQGDLAKGTKDPLARSLLRGLQKRLFGFDLDRGAVRTFALPRIADLEVTTTLFERPADFSLSNHLGGSRVRAFG